MDAESILKQFKGIKGEGMSQFPERDVRVGTYVSTVVGVEFPKTQRYAAQGHYQWIVKTKATDTDKTMNNWVTVNVAKKTESAAYFSSIACKLQKATGSPVGNAQGETSMEIDEAIACINALANKPLKVTQTFNGKKYEQQYDAINA